MSIFCVVTSVSAVCHAAGMSPCFGAVVKTTAKGPSVKHTDNHVIQNKVHFRRGRRVFP